MRLIDVIEATDETLRDRALEQLCAGASTDTLRAQCDELDRYARGCSNLYHRVRALLFLHALHRYHLPAAAPQATPGTIPCDGYRDLLGRRFDRAIEAFTDHATREGHTDAVTSGLALAYRGLAFQTLADQVRASVRSVRGNEWMFEAGSATTHPVRLRPELLTDRHLLRERTPVRMDLSHSGWSDIFFLGMDYPEGARVVNVSVDLGVRGRHDRPSPPIECDLRVLDRPVLRLRSVDLRCTAEVRDVARLFDFAADYLGLLKAAVIAAGLFPPALEGSDAPLQERLAQICGAGRGLEIVSRVRDIPKGSRLAVSTNLLGSLIAVCMRATGQTRSLEGPLTEGERRLVAARAILGEWLGGSGGGWQDSGGLWPGIKRIAGVRASPGDPEYGVSRGCLLPQHQPIPATDAVRRALQDSMVLVHGGIAKDVGPVLEMVTEKYLLRSARAWRGRQDAALLFDEIVDRLQAGDARGLGRATSRNFEGPIRTIIPQATDAFTERVIARARARFGDDYWGFCMLGGMSGGGMGFLFSPDARPRAADGLHEILLGTRDELAHALPFAMDPVVYDFEINDRGTVATLESPPAEAEPTSGRTAPPPDATPDSGGRAELDELLQRHGFDSELHEHVRTELRGGRIGLARNRMPTQTRIEDAAPGDLVQIEAGLPADDRAAGRQALAEGRVAVVTLAAGAGSRWTRGAGVVKALHPFAVFGDRHRSFLEVHLAKSARTGRRAEHPLPHVFTTSYLTHDPIEQHLKRHENHGYEGPLLLSPGRAVGLRMIPMARDLAFAWEEMPQQMLDEQAEKVRGSLRTALTEWARSSGEGADYTDNLALQCLHPVGHWFEVPNLLRNGVLATLLRQRPQLDHLLLHNIDTLGASVDDGLLGHHIRRGADLTFEVVPRRVEDRGGGLARIDGRPQLVESMALPRDEDELRLSYYNSMTTWVAIDRLLALFELDRDALSEPAAVADAVRRMADRMPTYVTLKDVKKRWGHAQEDVYPVCQFEKLWSDMTALPEADCHFVAVSRFRGQQLKDPAELDPWLRDGSAEQLAALCEW